MTGSGVNDTSVIRGPAIKKAGRWEAYGPVQQTGVWCVPRYVGVEDKYHTKQLLYEIHLEGGKPLDDCKVIAITNQKGGVGYEKL